MTDLDAPLGVPESYRGARRSAVRPPGGRVPGRPDARVHVHDGARRQQPHVSGARTSAEAHHRLSHHGGKPEQIAKHARLNTYHMQLFAKFSRSCARRPTATARSRSLAHPLRQRHEQRQRARARSAAARDHGRRGWARATGTSRMRRRRRSGTSGSPWPRNSAARPNASARAPDKWISKRFACT